MEVNVFFEAILIVIALLVALVLIMSTYCLHKIRKVHYKTRKTHLLLKNKLAKIENKISNQLQQQQCLQILEREIQLDEPLPITRGWAASPDFLVTLVKHAKENTPKNIVECSSGVSTLILAKCASLNGVGHVYSLEHDPEYAVRTRADLEEHRLESYATILEAPLIKVQLRDREWDWYSLQNLPDIKIDMLVIDGPPSYLNDWARYPAGPMLFERLNEFGAAFLDDADREYEQQIVADWRREFPNLTYTSLPCEKGCIRVVKPSGSNETG